MQEIQQFPALERILNQSCAATARCGTGLWLRETAFLQVAKTHITGLHNVKLLETIFPERIGVKRKHLHCTRVSSNQPMEWLVKIYDKRKLLADQVFNVHLHETHIYSIQIIFYSDLILVKYDGILWIDDFGMQLISYVNSLPLMQSASRCYHSH